jgi:hypothetical protein
MAEALERMAGVLDESGQRERARTHRDAAAQDRDAAKAAAEEGGPAGGARVAARALSGALTPSESDSARRDLFVPKQSTR